MTEAGRQQFGDGLGGPMSGVGVSPIPKKSEDSVEITSNILIEWQRPMVGEMRMPRKFSLDYWKLNLASWTNWTIEF